MNIQIAYEINVYDLDGEADKVVLTLSHEYMSDTINNSIHKEVTEFINLEQFFIRQYVKGENK
jgi:hypothetical protein|tara:strand:- start:68 stop:256 length:189 start_codon:yes stop_codon:yes gene_type:complete